MNGTPINLFAIEQENCFLLNLEQMKDNTAYFIGQQPKTIAIEISVTKETDDGGFESSELKRVLLNTDIGVSKSTPVLSKQNKNLLPSVLESPTLFVNMNTFREIVSVLLGREVDSVNKVAETNDFVCLSGIYVCVDDLSVVSSISSFLTEQNYSAYAPLDAFDNFGETISVTFMVFMLSSFVLLCMTTINIFLSFRSFYRVQQKDMGVLRYMGFSNKRIFRMYCKNLRRKFIQIMIISSAFIFLLGMVLFSFSHWFVLSAFIVSLFVLLCILFFVITRFIIYNYVKQDLLVLIRESKEFE